MRLYVRELAEAVLPTSVPVCFTASDVVYSVKLRCIEKLFWNAHLQLHIKILRAWMPKACYGIHARIVIVSSGYGRKQPCLPY